MTAALLAISADAGRSVGQQAAATLQCTDFTSGGRLVRGMSVRAPIGRGLDVVLSGDEFGWALMVAPRLDPDTDYMWIVSPPWQTAPHRVLGAGYGYTAEQSLTMKRELRFVVSAADHREALATYAAAASGPAEGVLERLQTLGRGTLTLEVTGFELAKQADGTSSERINWIEFKGVACVPVDGA